MAELEELLEQGKELGEIKVELSSGPLEYSRRKLADPAYLAEQRTNHETYAQVMQEKNQEGLQAWFNMSEHYRDIERASEFVPENVQGFLITLLRPVIYLTFWSRGLSPNKIFAQDCRNIMQQCVQYEQLEECINAGMSIMNESTHPDAAACAAIAKDISFSFRQIVERGKKQIMHEQKFYKMLFGKDISYD